MGTSLGHRAVCGRSRGEGYLEWGRPGHAQGTVREVCRDGGGSQVSTLCENEGQGQDDSEWRHERSGHSPQMSYEDP